MPFINLDHRPLSYTDVSFDDESSRATSPSGGMSDTPVPSKIPSASKALYETGKRARHPGLQPAPPVRSHTSESNDLEEAGYVGPAHPLNPGELATLPGHEAAKISMGAEEGSRYGQVRRRSSSYFEGEMERTNGMNETLLFLNRCGTLDAVAVKQEDGKFHSLKSGLNGGGNKPSSVSATQSQKNHPNDAVTTFVRNALRAARNAVPESKAHDSKYQTYDRWYQFTKTKGGHYKGKDKETYVKYLERITGRTWARLAEKYTEFVAELNKINETSEPSGSAAPAPAQQEETGKNQKRRSRRQSIAGGSSEAHPSVPERPKTSLAKHRPSHQSHQYEGTWEAPQSLPERPKTSLSKHRPSDSKAWQKEALKSPTKKPAGFSEATIEEEDEEVEGGASLSPSKPKAGKQRATGLQAAIEKSGSSGMVIEEDEDDSEDGDDDEDELEGGASLLPSHGAKQKDVTSGASILPSDEAIQDEIEALHINNLNALYADYRADPAYSVPDIFRADNLQFVTKQKGRLPTLYFSSPICDVYGEVAYLDGRLRQEHKNGSMANVRYDKTTVHCFFRQKSEMKKFKHAVSKALKEGRTLPEPTDARFRGSYTSFQKAHHMECVFGENSYKSHISGGVVDLRVGRYADDDIIAAIYWKIAQEMEWPS